MRNELRLVSVNVCASVELGEHPVADLPQQVEPRVAVPFGVIGILERPVGHVAGEEAPEPRGVHPGLTEGPGQVDAAARHQGSSGARLEPLGVVAISAEDRIVHLHVAEVVAAG